MGKGSSRRPTDDKKFADNFDRIFNNKQKKSKTTKKDLQNRTTDDLKS